MQIPCLRKCISTQKSYFYSYLLNYSPVLSRFFRFLTIYHYDLLCYNPFSLQRAAFYVRHSDAEKDGPEDEPISRNIRNTVGVV